MKKLSFILLSSLWAITAVAQEKMEIPSYLEQVSILYDQAMSRGALNNYSMKKSYLNMLISSPFAQREVENICRKGLGLLEEYVEKVTQICSEHPYEPASHYFLEEYLPLYRSYDSQKLAKVILFFIFGLGEVQDPQELIQIREIILANFIKQDIARNLVKDPRELKDLQQEIEEEKLEKILAICLSSQDPYLQDMYAELEAYQTVDQYCEKIELSGEFAQKLERLRSSFQEDSFEARVLALVGEYDQRKTKLIGSLI